MSSTIPTIVSSGTGCSVISSSWRSRPGSAEREWREYGEPAAGQQEVGERPSGGRAQRDTQRAASSPTFGTPPALLDPALRRR
jgi:hypothetical protein